MKIGDKIRLLHDKEEGIIRRIIDSSTVEVEIEDGFLIPVLKNEIVPIAPEEKEEDRHTIQSFSKEYQEPGNLEETWEKNIFLAITAQQHIQTGWIIINTNDKLCEKELFAKYKK